MPRKKPAKHFLPPWLRRHLEKRAARAAVRTRDGDDCWLCGYPMRFGHPFNVGKAATIEHLLPRAQGGTWDLENLVLCHKGCNKHLGTHSPKQKLRMRNGRARSCTIPLERAQAGGG